MPSSPQSGQTAFLGLGLVPSTKTALEDYTTFVNSADPKDPAVQAQSIQLSRRILEGDLTAMTALKKKEKILSEDVEGELHIRPLPAPALKKPAGVADLSRIVSKDNLRPAMTGVFLDVDNKCMVATNGHIMAIIPDWTLTGKKRIINLSTQKEIDERYPDYQNVIPVDRKLVATVNDLVALRAQLYGLVQANKLIDVSNLRTIRAEISYGSYYYYYDPQFLLDLVTVLQTTGSTALNLEFDSTPNRALAVRDALDPKKVGIIMPIMNNLGVPSTERTTTWPFCTVLQFTGDEKPTPAPASVVPQLFVPGSFAKVRPLPAGAHTVYPQQKKWAGHTGKVVAVNAESISLDFNGEVVGDWSDWQLDVATKGKGKKKAATPAPAPAPTPAPAPALAPSYQPPKELLAALGFELLSKEVDMTWYSYNEPAERRSVRLTFYSSSAFRGVRIEDDREGGRRSKVYEGTLRDKQEFQEKLALVHWKKFDFKTKSPAAPVKPKKETSTFDWNPETIAVGEQLRAATKLKKGDEVMVATSAANSSTLGRHEQGFAGQTGVVVKVDLAHDGKKPYISVLVKVGAAGEGATYPERFLKKVKAAKMKEAKPTPTPLDYFDAKGKAVTDLTGKIDPEKLYYVQPDGSYEQGGDRRSPGHVKPPKAKKVKAPKVAKPAKVKPVDTRAEVPQISPDVLIMQAFLKLENKPATIDQVRALHRRIEKDFTKHKVRKTSKHADLLRGIAGTVAALYTRMTEKGIGSIAKLEFKTEDAKQLVTKARHEVEGVRVGTATTLLSAFVNLQGTVPTEKTVLNLRTKLENEFAEYPDGDFALAVGAAAAVLKDWKPGKPVRVTKQQLSGLSGLMDLGCPGTPPGKSCGCSAHGAAPKKSTALAGAPVQETSIYPDFTTETGTWDYNPTPETAAPVVSTETGLFTTIGQKDASRPVGPALRLPGELGKFLGSVIERHEWALAMRGEKGAGKSRLQYQILNLFAALGLSCALFSLEIDKNSSVVEDYTNAYIAPANRARVKCASEAPGGLKAIREAATQFDVVAVDSWGKIPGVEPTDFDKIRKEFPATLFVVIFQSTSAGTARGGPAAEYDASAVCQVNLPGVAVMEKNRYAKGPADEWFFDVNTKKLVKNPKYN